MSKPVINPQNIPYKLICERIRLYGVPYISDSNTFASDVLEGLIRKPKSLPPKYFYDDRGSELFVSICATPEYYVTRTESEILLKHADDIAAASGNEQVIVELGSGASVKTKYLIEAFQRLHERVRYIPIDVANIIIPSSVSLSEEYKNLCIDAVQAEYEEGVGIASAITDEPKMIIFLGSSIGNFSLVDSEKLVISISDNMNVNDKLLIGFDMVKDIEVLNDAYNDAEGYTAEFNLNLLERINNSLGGQFNLNSFAHKAFFNAKESRIEMHLVSLIEQSVRVRELDEEFNFAKGETIHTENSYKFTPKMIEEIAGAAGLKILDKWCDSKEYFSLCLFGKE